MNKIIISILVICCFSYCALEKKQGTLKEGFFIENGNLFEVKIIANKTPAKLSPQEAANLVKNPLKSYEKKEKEEAQKYFFDFPLVKYSAQIKNQRISYKNKRWIRKKGKTEPKTITDAYFMLITLLSAILIIALTLINQKWKIGNHNLYFSYAAIILATFLTALLNYFFEFNLIFLINAVLCGFSTYYFGDKSLGNTVIGGFIGFFIGQPAYHLIYVENHQFACWYFLFFIALCLLLSGIVTIITRFTNKNLEPS